MLYLDAYILLNFMMDAAALKLASIPGTGHIKLRRLILAALVGVSISCIILLFVREQSFFVENIGEYAAVSVIHIIVNPLMTFVAFGRCRIREFLVRLTILYATVFLLGGCFSYVQQVVFGGRVSVVACGGMSVGISFFTAHIVMQVRKRTAHIYPVVLENNGVSKRFLALYDSGNLLKDPYVHKPVSLLCECEVIPEWHTDEKSRYMVMETAASEQSLLRLQTFERMSIENSAGKIVIERPVIGISKANAFCRGKCQVLLHGELLEG